MTVTTEVPRILDASAVVETFSGNRELMTVLEAASDGRLVAVLPIIAMIEAQAVLAAKASHWDLILALSGVHAVLATEEGVTEIGNLAAPRVRYHPDHRTLLNPIMTAQVLHEAKMMNGVIMTRVPEAYGGHDVTVHLIN
ncbi:MAG TPA: hypothetical protein VN408_27515 [Actinoplanes sp.]|nr:hypothetical protein [Actinoplanes sp.]